MDRYEISFFVPGLVFDGDTPTRQALGGAETAGWAVARELAKRGHRVRVFCNLPGERGVFEGVNYWHLNDALPYFANIPHDFSIVQRAPEVLANKLAGRFRLLWCHDLALGRAKNKFNSVLWNVDRVCLVSDYMVSQYKDVYGLDTRLPVVCHNGIHPELFPQVELERDRYMLVYSARPERGLDVLIEKVMPRLLDRLPEVRLMIYGYDNPVQHLQPFYDDLKAKSLKFEDHIRFGGFLPKDKLYEAYARAGVYVYPTPSPTMPEFNEVACISAMEAQAAGLPVVSSRRGALVETVHPEAGILIDGDPSSDAYLDTFTDAVVGYITNDDMFRQASGRGRAWVPEAFSWAKAADQWEALFDELLRANNDDPVRLAHHFYRRSDISAAKRVLGTTDDPRADDLRAKIAAEYRFTANEQALRKHYARGGKRTLERLRRFPVEMHRPLLESTDEPRLNIITALLEQDAGLKRVLDFGCGHGWSTILFYNRLKRDFVGVDIDAGAVEWSDQMAGYYRKPEVGTLVFHRLDNATHPDLSALGEFDAAVVSEVLEHCPDPAAIMERVEATVKPGGVLIVTVPFGPAEYSTDNWRHFRNHVHEFDTHDLRDMFGAKPGLVITSTAILPNAETGDPVGFFTIIYKADHKSLGDIDWDRKLRLQRPRQTVSVNLICGDGAEVSLRWCLTSVQWIADEIIIADTGMNDEGLRIAHEFGCKLVPAKDPKLVGFDEARNAALHASVCDWVFWIDSDERLVCPANIGRYTHNHLWHGISVRQHHFAVDSTFNPDLPVRLFRRRPLDGKTMQFIGRCHEHPELALNEGPGPVLVVPDLDLAHVGYLHEMVRQHKFARNYPLVLMDKRDYPTRLLQKYFIMRDNTLLNSYELQVNGGVITPAVRARAQETVELFRAHFAGKFVFKNLTPTTYYTQALRVLGLGVDVSFAFAAQRDGQGQQLNGGEVMRFADADEALKEIDRRVREQMEPLQARLW